MAGMFLNRLSAWNALQDGFDRSLKDRSAVLYIMWTWRDGRGILKMSRKRNVMHMGNFMPIGSASIAPSLGSLPGS